METKIVYIFYFFSQILSPKTADCLKKVSYFSNKSPAFSYQMPQSPSSVPTNFYSILDFRIKKWHFYGIKMTLGGYKNVDSLFRM